MTKEDLIAMARQSHLDVFGLGKDQLKFMYTLEGFAKLIEARTREECARLVEAIEAKCVIDDVDDRPLFDVAASIRSMGERT